MADADETIITRLILETGDFLKKTREGRDEVNTLIRQLKVLADTEVDVPIKIGDEEVFVKTKQSIKDIGDQLLKLADLELEGMQKSLGDKMLKESEKEAIKKRIKEIKQEITDLKKAIREANKEESLLAQQSAKQIRENANLAKQSAKEKSKVEQDALRASKAAQTEYQKITRQGYGVMSKAAQQYGQQVSKTAQIIQRTAQRTGQSWNQVGQRMANLGRPIQQVNNALQQLNTQTTQSATGLRGLISRVTNLGNISQLVFGGIIGISAVQAIQQATRAFVDFAKEILRRGTEMTEVMFTFEVAVRGLQRIGLDTTIEGWTERIQELKKEFPFFPKREFTEAASLAALMTREFGFTEEQIANIVRQSAILAQITGKDLLESVRGITFAIGSGYFESLQRAGVNISRAVVKNEALAQGYTGVYNELEPAIRASVTYSVIQKNLSAIQDDASEKSRTFAGQVQILTSTLEDLKNTLGEVVTGSDTFIETLEKLNESLISIKDTYAALQELDIDVFVPLKALFNFLLSTDIEANIEALSATLQGLANTIETLVKIAPTIGAIAGALGSLAGIVPLPGWKTAEKVLKGIREELQQLEGILGELEEKEGIKSIKAPIELGEISLTQEEYQEVVDATQELQDEIIKIEEDAQKRRIEVEDDYNANIEKDRINHYRKMEDLAEDHQQKLDDIELKRSQRIADEIANYQFRVAETQRDAAFRREEAERKYRERELKEERRFQEKLRQLRENFLFDLEDAVRERDARQIIRLTRQYNLRRDQMIREEKLSKDDRKNAFAEELRQIEFQRQERLRQLAVEHARRLQEIDIQAQRERERAELEFQRRQEDERLRWEQQKAERKERLDERLADIDTATQERINKVVEGLLEEYELTDDQLDGIAMLWESVYGPDGRIENALAYNEARANAHMVWLNKLLSQADALRFLNIQAGGYLGTPPDLDYAGGQAEGGTIIAKKPTVAIFGEAGPEMATFTPLNKLADIAPFGGQMVGSRDPMNGKLRLEMLLSPDLEARIVDDAMNEVADVIYTIERERK